MCGLSKFWDWRFPYEWSNQCDINRELNARERERVKVTHIQWLRNIMDIFNVYRI